MRKLNILAAAMLLFMLPAHNVSAGTKAPLLATGYKSSTQEVLPLILFRAEYSIGATAPMGIPPTITSIDAFRLTASYRLGFEATAPFAPRWGLTSGLLFESKCMDADVTTKGYPMVMQRGDEHLEGIFTGHISQQVDQKMLTIPLYVNYAANSKLVIRAGIYGSLFLKKEFSGIASDGYLRTGGPTGPKINIGSTPSTWASYDFSKEMRSLQAGFGVGIDWVATPRLGFSADFTMGFTGIFKSDFKTVEQTLYPIYGSIGLIYRIL